MAGVPFAGTRLFILMECYSRYERHATVGVEHHQAEHKAE